MMEKKEVLNTARFLEIFLSCPIKLRFFKRLRSGASVAPLASGLSLKHGYPNREGEGLWEHQEQKGAPPQHHGQCPATPVALSAPRTALQQLQNCPSSISNGGCFPMFWQLRPCNFPGFPPLAPGASLRWWGLGPSCPGSPPAISLAPGTLPKLSNPHSGLDRAQEEK